MPPVASDVDVDDDVDDVVSDLDQAEIKTDMSSPPRAPPDLHWQSEITWVINDRGDDDDKTDDIIFRIGDGSNVFHNYFDNFHNPKQQQVIYQGGVHGGSPLRGEYWSGIWQNQLYQQSLC